MKISKLLIVVAFAIIQFVPSNIVWADSYMVVVCEAGSWSGHRIGWQPFGSSKRDDGSNSISFKEYVFIVPLSSEKKLERIFVRYGGEKDYTASVRYTYMDDDGQGYMIAEAQPYDILETIIIDIPSYNVVIQNVKKMLGGLSVDVFAKSCMGDVVKN